ncbi:MAG: tryptophan 7-halogenase [Acidobacteriota bacterium]
MPISEIPSTNAAEPLATRYDVVVFGGGLAGLTLARHLLLDTDKSVLLVERRDALPPDRQKVGESTVQVGGDYLARVLDMEEHLLHEHFMKYNLRFYWKTAGHGESLEDYSQAFIRKFSNVASYQIDRNRFEAELLQRIEADARATVRLGVAVREVAWGADGADHSVHLSIDGAEQTIDAGWVVDATGRGRLLARREDLRRDNPIDHGAFFWWVDGLVDIERLTGQTHRERRLDPRRRRIGHLPQWLATNHFMGEGFWFWVIPLRGKTSLGLVYDRSLVESDEVFSVEKATHWICRQFPLFARDLPQRKVLDFGGYKSYSYDCHRTINAERWALTGEAGRFSDPLYSPGTDLIAIYNTLIVDAIATEDPQALAAKCQMAEPLMRSVYAAYEPSYATSYDALGDSETFVLKYGWELSIYFGFYVFPFLNDLLVERRFVPSFLKAFARLGPWNRTVQSLLSDFFQWKKEHAEPITEPVDTDFTEIDTLRHAESTFYRVGASIEEARQVLHGQLGHLEELAGFIATRVAAVVLDDPGLLADRRFADACDLAELRFDTAVFAQLRERSRALDARPWNLDPTVMDRFDTAVRSTSKRPAAPAAATAAP